MTEPTKPAPATDAEIEAHGECDCRYSSHGTDRHHRACSYLIVPRIKARIEAEKALREELVAVLKEAVETFRRYAEIHRSKETPAGDRKARENYAIAERMEVVLARAEAWKKVVER